MLCMSIFPAYLYVHLMHACSCQSLKRTSDSLELELCMFLSYHMSAWN